MRWSTDILERLASGSPCGYQASGPAATEPTALAALGSGPSQLRSYTKAALVGTGGDLEHGAAMIHPRLGMAMRGTIKRGRVIIPGHAKVGPPGSMIDLLYGPLDAGWDLDAVDSTPVLIHDAPRPDEIVLWIGYGSGPRVNARSKGPDQKEVDALIVMGASPLTSLVAPRVLACALAVPLLTVVLDASAILGGMAAELAATLQLAGVLALEFEVRRQRFVLGIGPDFLLLLLRTDRISRGQSQQRGQAEGGRKGETERIHDATSSRTQVWFRRGPRPRE